MAQAEPKLARVQLRVPGKQRMSFRLPARLVQRIDRIVAAGRSAWILEVLAEAADGVLGRDVAVDRYLPGRIKKAALADGREVSKWAERALTKAIKESG